MKVSRFVMLLVITLFLSCDGDEPVRLKGAVTGRVGYNVANRYVSIDSLAGVVVTIQNEAGEKWSQTTGSDGMYRFDDLEAGHYWLDFEKGQTQEIDAVLNNGGRLIRISHLGGAPTILQTYYLSERPAFATEIVSFTRDGLMLDLKIKAGIVGVDYFLFLVLFGDESVSITNHRHMVSPFHQNLVVDNIEEDATYLTLVEHVDDATSTHMIIYPVSLSGLNIVGPPSNVIKVVD